MAEKPNQDAAEDKLDAVQELRNAKAELTSAFDDPDWWVDIEHDQVRLHCQQVDAHVKAVIALIDSQLDPLLEVKSICK